MVFLWKIYGFFIENLWFLWFFYGKFTPLRGEGGRQGQGQQTGAGAGGRGRGSREGQGGGGGEGEWVGRGETVQPGARS